MTRNSNFNKNNNYSENGDILGCEPGSFGTGSNSDETDTSNATGTYSRSNTGYTENGTYSLSDTGNSSGNSSEKQKRGRESLS